MVNVTQVNHAVHENTPAAYLRARACSSKDFPRSSPVIEGNAGVLPSTFGCRETLETTELSTLVTRNPLETLVPVFCRVTLTQTSSVISVKQCQ
jgi:hypothetical protein